MVEYDTRLAAQLQLSMSPDGRLAVECVARTVSELTMSMGRVLPAYDTVNMLVDEVPEALGVVATAYGTGWKLRPPMIYNSEITVGSVLAVNQPFRMWLRDLGMRALEMSRT